jgi:5,5'-dehydrodivanillate O-demethylase oxygenase subunit
MWETQGVVADRTKEHLGNSDKGVALLRKVMFEEIEKVQRGEDPMGVVRDERVIDTNLEASLTMRYPTGTKTKTVPITKESV